MILQMIQHEITFRIRYAECDPGGVAHHSSYTAWLEMGRTELLRARGVRYRDLEAQGIYIVVVKLEINYRKPAQYDDEVTLRTTLAKTSRVKIEHEYELRRENEVLATARTVLACVNSDGNVLPVPDSIAMA